MRFFIFLLFAITCATAGAADKYKLRYPLGLKPMLVPKDNQLTAAKIELGKQLYFDPRLSCDDTISCAS